MNTIVRKFSEGLEKVKMTYLLSIARRYIKHFGYDKDAVLEDVVTHAFDDLNSKYHYIDDKLVSSFTKRHLDDLLYVLTDVFPELDEEINALDNKHLHEARSTVNRKKLYESIMRDVSKIIKKHLK